MANMLLATVCYQKLHEQKYGLRQKEKLGAMVYLQPTPKSCEAK